MCSRLYFTQCILLNSHASLHVAVSSVAKSGLVPRKSSLESYTARGTVVPATRRCASPQTISALLCPLRMSATPDPVVSSKRRNCNLFVLQRPRAPQQPPLTQQIKVGANPREPFRTCTCTCTESRIIYLSIYLCGSLFSRPARAILQYCIVELRSIFSTSEIIVFPRFFESGFQFRGILDHYPHLGKL